MSNDTPPKDRNYWRLTVLGLCLLLVVILVLILVLILVVLIVVLVLIVVAVLILILHGMLSFLCPPVAGYIP